MAFHAAFEQSTTIQFSTDMDHAVVGMSYVQWGTIGKVAARTCSSLECSGITGDLGDRTVWHVARIHEIRAGHSHEAPGIYVGLTGGGVAGIDHGDAIEVEVVAVKAWRQWSLGDFPPPLRT